MRVKKISKIEVRHYSQNSPINEWGGQPCQRVADQTPVTGPVAPSLDGFPPSFLPPLPPPPDSARELLVAASALSHPALHCLAPRCGVAADLHSQSAQGAEAPLPARQNQCRWCQRHGSLDAQPPSRLGGLIGGRSRATTSAMWFCSWRAAIALRSASAKERAGSPPRRVVRGRFRRKPLPTGLAIQDDPYRAWSWP